MAPIYEFECTNPDCDREDFEVMQRITDRPFLICDTCGKPTLKKKVSLVSFALKGGGWAKDGYKGAGTKNEGGGEGC
jgi:putative FmdB family regulatory protein